MNACEHCRDLLIDLIYEDLEPAARWEAEDHLRKCRECAREFDELKKTLGAVRDLADPEPPLGLKTRVKAQVKAAIPRQTPRWAKLPRRVYAAAAMIVIGVSVGLILATQYSRLAELSAPSSQGVLAEKDKGKEVALLTPPAPEVSAAAKTKDEKVDNAVGFANGASIPEAPPADEPLGPPKPTAEEAPPAPPAEAPTIEPTTAEEDFKMKAMVEPAPAPPEPVAEPKKTDELAKNEPTPPAPTATGGAPGAAPATPPAPATAPAPVPAPAPEILAKKEAEIKETPGGWFGEPTKKEPEKPASVSADQPKEKKAPEAPPSVGKGEAAPEGAAREETQPKPPAAGLKDRDALEKPAPKPQPETKSDDGAKAGGGADKKRPAPPWEGPGARSAPAPAPSAPTPPADHAAGNVTPASPLDQADALETQGRYKQALTTYEDVLHSSGYPGEAPSRARKPESESKPSADSKSVVKPRCGSDTTRAVNGALRCYKRLLQFSKARELEDWYKNQCQR